MIRSLYTAATGMKANQMYVDSISHNLSNVNTIGFKKSKLEFQDLLYQTLSEPGGGKEDGAKDPAGLQVGLGVRSIANQKVFTQGNLQQTRNPTDLAVSGRGFFQVSLPNGEPAFTRAGAFSVSADGTLVTSNGYIVEPAITLPEDTTEVMIEPGGRVMVRLVNTEAYEDVGQIELGSFVNENGLKSIGNNLFVASEASGPAEMRLPTEDGLGSVEQGFLESSNVELVDEMVNMIVAQRAYEISSKAIQTAEDMLQTANQLRR